LEKPENLVFSGFFFVIRSFCNQVSANTLILLAT